MRGIRLSHGVLFVTDDHLTVRLLPSGECGASPISYEVLEWDLRTEPPDSWDYLDEAAIRALPDGGFESIRSAFAKMRRQFNLPEDK